MPDFPDANDPGAGSPDVNSPPGTNNPDINPKTLEGRLPAVSSEGQVTAIHNNFLNTNRPRIAQLAQIVAKYDGINGPYDTAKLLEVGSGWYSNFSTRALGRKADVVGPRLKMRVKQAPYVTASALPGEYLDAYNKSVSFQSQITKTIRSGKKYDTFVGGVAHEVSLVGKAIIAFKDQWTPWPTIYRTDKAFLPEGVEVNEWDVGICSIQEFFRQDQLFDQIRDKDAAEAAGWDIEQVVKEINLAAVVPATTATDVYMARTYQDLLRESTPGYSYQQGNNVIEVIINFSTEYDKSVTQWIVGKQSGKKLFHANYPDMVMADFVMPWTFQYGNGTFYGSYGIGHLIYDLCVQLEKASNRAFDSYWNSTRFFIEVEAGQMQKANLSIQDDVTYSEGGQFAGNKAAYPNALPQFAQLMQIFDLIANDIVGSYTPEPTDAKARPIAAQANINEMLMDDRSVPTTDLFLTQWARLIWMQQRRLCRKNSPIKEAEDCRAALLKVMSEEELDVITNNPPYDITVSQQKDDTERGTAFLVEVVKNNDPYYDPIAVRKQLNTRFLGPDGGNGLLNDQVNNNQQIVQSRQQQMETYSMSDGHQIPVAPTDNHAIHMAFLKGKPSPQGLDGPLPQAVTVANQAVQSGDLQAAQKLANIAAIYYQHYIQHFDFAVETPGKKPWENDEKAFIAQMGKLLNMINAHLDKAVEQQNEAGNPPGSQRTAKMPTTGNTPIPGAPPTTLPGHPAPAPAPLPQPQR